MTFRPAYVLFFLALYTGATRTDAQSAITATPGTGTLSTAIANAASGSAILLQPGHYIETSPILVTSKPLSITGQGKRVTFVDFRNSDGFRFYLDEPSDRLTIGNFSLTTNTTNAHIGLQLFGKNSHYGSKVHDIEFMGLQGTGNDYFWQTALKLDRTSATSVVNCEFLGTAALGPLYTFLGTSVEALSTINLTIDRCTGVGANYGIKAGTSQRFLVDRHGQPLEGVHGPEGTTISNTNIGQANRNVWIDGGVVTKITNSEFGFAHEYGVYSNAAGLRLENSFVEVDRSEATAVYLDTHAVDSGVVSNRISSLSKDNLGRTIQNVNGIIIHGDRVNIANNSIDGLQYGPSMSVTMQNGVWIPRSGDNNVVVSGNVINNTTTSCVWLSEGASRNFVGGNICRSTGGGVVDRSGNGTNKLDIFGGALNIQY